MYYIMTINKSCFITMDDIFILMENGLNCLLILDIPTAVF